MAETEFGAELGKLRELAGFTQRQLASRTGGSAPSLSRWETGKFTPKRDDVERLDKALNANGRLIKVWQEETSGSQIPPWMRAIGALEGKAVTIDTVTVSIVPGLVQCLSYAREVFHAGRPPISAEEIEKLAQLRVQRFEALIGKNDPFVTAIFPEFALSWAPEAVRVEQAKALLKFVQRGRMAVHIIPNGSTVLSLIAPVQLYRLEDGSLVAATNHGSGNLVYETASQAAIIEAKVRDVLGRSLPVDHSIALLKEML